MKPREFNQRLRMACDNLPEIVPPYGQGRQVYIARKLKVTQEAVRKWFTGDARPKLAKMKELAKILDVDEAWLSLGIEPELDRVEKRVHNDKSEGAVYVLFGMMSMGGGHCAFPNGRDGRSEYVDFYSIIGGQQVAFHVSMGRETSKDVFAFALPSAYQETMNVGVIHVRGFKLQFIHLKHDIIETHKQRKGSGYQVVLNRIDNDYRSGSDKWPMLQQIGDIF